MFTAGAVWKAGAQHDPVTTAEPTSPGGRCGDSSDTRECLAAAFFATMRPVSAKDRYEQDEGILHVSTDRTASKTIGLLMTLALEKGG